ncbi:MAG: hypothetical protein JSS79_13090 [Bacteroidetes bacterium]|nr:hypothetical protein [Bacteroidota bacterium]
MKIRSLVFFLFFILVIGTIAVKAQPGDPGGGDPDVPITGIEYLVGAGALLGIRKFIKKNSNRA